MAGQSENNKVSSQAGLASFRGAPAPRPSHRTVALWEDLQAALGHLNHAQFHLGLLAAKPTVIDWDAVETQLDDARQVLGRMALELSEGAES